MENTWNFTPETTVSNKGIDYICRLANATESYTQPRQIIPRIGEFKKITHENMNEVWSMLCKEPGKTTDFSYGGVLMWVDFFNYEYAIYDNTLFIKGVVENDLNKPAFSLPVGKLPLRESVDLLKEYCDSHNIELEFSAIPEYALDLFKPLNPKRIELLQDWGDYLYDAQSLATLAGKKMSKKRNHVHQFIREYPDWHVEILDSTNADSALKFMDIFDLEGDSGCMAQAERALSRDMISKIKEGDDVLKGMILYADGKVCAYTIGDIKGDTLFVHIEKATREVTGSYEMINHVFAKHIIEQNPEVRFINREDDAGDIGLRMAKESYHPLEVLKKYNISF